MEIVLVRAKRGGNVAAAARAMANMDLRRLTLVDVNEPDVDERALAYGALDVIDEARRVPDLRAAVAHCVFVAATSARKGKVEWTPRRLAMEVMSRKADEGPIAVVFGPEDSGLTRAELNLCHACVRIPSAAVHQSLNLAQAVMVVAYELFVMRNLASEAQRRENLATVSEIERCMDALRSSLLAIGYLNPQNPEAILAELRRMLVRAGPTTREMTLLRGVARQMLWSARVRSQHTGGGAMPRTAVGSSRTKLA